MTLNDPSAPGALARIGVDQRLSALTLARSGRVYDLGLDLNDRVPQGNPNDFDPFRLWWRTTPEQCAAHGHAHQFAAETITGTLHIGTHIDGLAHIAAEGRLYGGYAVEEVRTDHGFLVNGIQDVPPIIGRAVLLDIAGLHGVPALPDAYEITIDDVREALGRGGVTITTGDIVCVRTGKVREYYTDPFAYQRSQPGVGPKAAIWMYEQGMSVLATDTTGTEPLPFPDENDTTHRAMLVDRGVHLIENTNLDGPAADGVVEALFICLPLRITGATGSWVRPVLVK